MQIPQCTSPVSHNNAPFCNRNVHICAHFCNKMVHCGLYVWCIVGFLRWVYWYSLRWLCSKSCFDHSGQWGKLPGRHCNCSFRPTTKRTLKIHFWSFCEGKPLVTGGVPSQRASNVESVSMARPHLASEVTDWETSGLHKWFVHNHDIWWSQCELGWYFATPIFLS